MLPEDEVPEKTDGYEGFFHLTEMSGSVTEATLRYIIRDHDRERFEEKKALLRRLRRAHQRNLRRRHGRGSDQ